jgi:hypothetical protein
MTAVLAIAVAAVGAYATHGFVAALLDADRRATELHIPRAVVVAYAFTLTFAVIGLLIA